MKKLINMQYTRNEIDFKRGTFRAKGDILEIYPSSQSESAVRVEFWGDEIEKITEINPLTGKGIGTRMHIYMIQKQLLLHLLFQTMIMLLNVLIYLFRHLLMSLFLYMCLTVLYNFLVGNNHNMKQNIQHCFLQKTP